MKKKIFRNMLLVGFSVLLLSSLLFTFTLARRFTGQIFDELTAEARLVGHGISLSGPSYLQDLEEPLLITWLSPDGEILYNTATDATDTPEDLWTCREIRDAAATGRGHAARFSVSVSTATLYAAVSLSDGSILRVATRMSALSSQLYPITLSLLLILLLTVLLAVLLSERLSRSIIRPILELDLHQSHTPTVYEEFTPLLQQLRQQRETIRDQLDTLNRRSEEFTAITENMTEGFLLTDSRGTLLSCNSSALRLLGSAAPKPGQSILSSAVAESFRHAVAEALAGRHCETTMEQDERTYRLLANCVHRGTRTAGAVVAILDVTEQESREKLRREFTANVSHELKTPLTSISGFAELMKNGLVPPETVPEFADDIYREAQRLISLVEDIIHLSRLDEGSLPLEHTRVDLHLLSGDILERLAPAAQKAGISLHLQGMPLTVTGVPSVLDEMIYNLAENAVKYNRSGGSVTITTLLTSDGPRLIVSDTGIGIPTAHQGRIFERFYRVDKSHSKEVGGTGLGLSIVKHAAAYHGASLSLESREGEGTTVTIQWK